MTPVSLKCPKCQATLLDGVFDRENWGRCPSCRVPLRCEVFPALFRPAATARPAENLMLEGEASCFYHAQKKAVVPCAACGRFLCALCDCELHGEHLCPPCLELGKVKGQHERLADSRVLYQNQALSLAVLPLFLTGLAAIYLALRYRKAPGSLVAPRRWLMPLALTLAIVQVAGLGILMFVLIYS